MRLQNVPRLDLLQNMEDLLEEIWELALMVDPESEVMNTIMTLKQQLEELRNEEDD